MLRLARRGSLDAPWMSVESPQFLLRRVDTSCIIPTQPATEDRSMINYNRPQLAARFEVRIGDKVNRARFTSSVAIRFAKLYQAGGKLVQVIEHRIEAAS